MALFLFIELKIELKNLMKLKKERRLLYVGMTKAEQKLFLTRSIRRKWLGTYKNLNPLSVILRKIKNELLIVTKLQTVFQEKER
jgi:superfamily I DNA/RNA helicase